MRFAPPYRAGDHSSPCGRGPGCVAIAHAPSARLRLSPPDASEAIAMPDGRAERAHPARCSEAITVIAPLGQTQFESCFRLVSRKLRARSPRVAVLLHHQPRALLFLQLRR